MPHQPDAPVNHKPLLPSLPLGITWVATQQGESGDFIYKRSDGLAFAKVAAAHGAESLNEERRRNEWLAPFGLGCAQVLDWRTAPEGACLVTSAVPGVPASALSGADLLTAWPSMAQRLQALHAVPVTGCPFVRSLSGMFARAADVVARGAVNPDFLAPEDRHTPPQQLLDALRAQLPERLAQEARERVVCHGDACMPNFMVDPGTLRCTGLIDLGRLGVADPYVDLALFVANARESWADAAQAQAARVRLFEVLGIGEPDDGRLAFYLGLDPLTWG
jgi:streptomycin 3"-kinase